MTEHEHLLRVFHEKANKCQTKEHMVVFCESFLKKHKKHNATEQYWIPTPNTLSMKYELNHYYVNKEVDRYNMEAAGLDAVEYGRIIRKEMYYDLMNDLVKNDIINFQWEYDIMRNATRYRADIVVGVKKK